MLLTVDEAASELRVHPATVRKMIKRGEIAAIRVGRIWRVDAAATVPRTIPQADPQAPAPYTAAFFEQLARPRPSAPALQAQPLDTGARSGQEGLTD